MKHFDITDWTDYVRGAGHRDDLARMESHLGSGCARCGRMVRLLSSVVSVAEAESGVQPPDYALRSVKAYFALQRPERARGLASLALQLAYDSSRESAPAGVRSGGAGGPNSRQIVYYAEQYALSLRMDFAGDTHRAVLGGEILNRQSEPIADVPAVLLADSRILSHSISDGHGEFRMEYDSELPVRLCLLVSDSECIDVTLEPAAGDAEAGSSPLH